MQMSKENHKMIFEFLYKKFRTQESFTKDELRSAVPGLTTGTMKTYWSKWIQGFLAQLDRENFRVIEAFRPFSTWEKFDREVCTQVRRTYQKYTEYTYDSLIIYDFLMPLSNEGHLRTTLDALFYKDTVLARLQAIGYEEVKKNLSIRDLDSPDDILEEACRWIAERFRGYSIAHVNGRFRAAELSTLADAAKFQTQGGHYLIDETTAIVRFIFHCGEAERRIVRGWKFVPLTEGGSVTGDYDSIDWLFRELFVENILQVVNGEDEIWMVESGVHNRLHRWVVE